MCNYLFCINIFLMVKEELFSWTNPDDSALDLEAVEATVMALLKVAQDEAIREGSRDLAEQSIVESSNCSPEPTNYPDLVPRTETFEASQTGKLSLHEKLVKSQPTCLYNNADQVGCSSENLAASEIAIDYNAADHNADTAQISEYSGNSGPNLSETLFLLAILFGTCILLYFFPPGPWISLSPHDNLGLCKLYSIWQKMHEGDGKIEGIRF